MTKKFYYVIRHAETAGVYYVTKVNEDLEPEGTYKTSSNPKLWPPCNCPSRQVPCKHVTMVKSFLHEQKPKGQYLDFDKEKSYRKQSWLTPSEN